MTIRLLTTVDEVRALVPAWRSLAAAEPRDNPFLSPEWTISWLEATPGLTPLVFAATDGDALRALLPLAVRRGRLGRVASFVEGNDYGLLAEGDRAAAAGALAAALRDERARWDVLQLGDLVPDRDDGALLEAALLEAGLAVAPFVTGAYPYVSTDGDLAAYERTVGKKVINELKRRQKQLEALGPVEFVQATTPDEAARYFPAIVDLHRRRWQDRSDTSGLSDDKRTEAMRLAAGRLAESGRFALDLMLHDGRVVAYSYGFRTRDRLGYYSPGFDPAWAPFSVSKILLHRQIRGCFESGRAEFDFGKGVESYKEVWASGTRPATTLLVTHEGAASRLAGRALAAREEVIRRLKTKPKVVHFKRVTLGRVRHAMAAAASGETARRAVAVLQRSWTDRGGRGTARRIVERGLASIHESAVALLFTRALPIDAPAPRDRITVTQLRPSEYAAFAEAMGRLDVAAVVARHYRGYRCWVAHVDGAFASYVWTITERQVNVLEIGEALDLSDDLFFEDAYTLPPYRGSGLYQLLLQHAMAASRARRAILVVIDGNAASIHCSEKCGFALARRVRRESWLGKVKLTELPPG